MNKFCLFIGNGFTIDFAEQLGLNPSEPLSHFHNHQISYNHFLHYIPEIKNELFLLEKQIPNDYEAIETYMKSGAYNVDKDSQLRRFLSFAYASFQIEVEQSNLICDWKWTKWFKENSEHFAFAISFNYDLVLEKALECAGISYYRTGSTEKKQGIPIMKPHGSIDFDVKSDGKTIEIHIEENVRKDKGNVQTIPKNNWFIPRFEADIIPPKKDNNQRSLRWVKNGIHTFLDRVSEINTFIIIGHSYGKADQNEVDQYLENLHPHTKLYLIDPKPNEKLVNKINSLGLQLYQPLESGLPW
ncbi:SIR2 family protein [Evansella sp. AB-P1]|uniref:SIR2 family protein n=1 Tax=Evansella sp. AB-P1 TaxID=3037653 RepID=UPI00241FA282|nr:SIR2 family protein [Evansella sp. AB-P1]MDG5786717.1 SIR2 family protein [Evansella sp. AB-P1]